MTQTHDHLKVQRPKVKDQDRRPRAEVSALCLLPLALCLLTSAYSLPLYRDSLPNGLVVLTYEDSRLPMAYLAVVCRSGAATDPLGKAGRASLAGDVMTRGTTTMSGDSVSSIVEFLGAAFYSVTDFDFTYLVLGLLSKDLVQGLDVIADAALHPSFDSAEVARLRNQALDNARMTMDSPMDVVDMELNRLLFPGHPYGSPTIGDTVTIPRLTRADLAEYHTTNFLPNNCFVVGVGNLMRDDLLAKVKARFGDWQPAPVTGPTVPVVPTPAGLRVKLIIRSDMNQTYVALGHLGIAMNDSDMMATRLAAHVLGGSPIDSRLGLAVREEGGLAYDVRCSFDRRLMTGAFRASVQTAKPAVAIEKMLREVRVMRDSGARAVELDDAKGYFTGSFPLSYSSCNGKAQRMGELEVYRFGTDWLDKFPDQVRAVTLEAANEAARNHLHPDQLVMVVMGNVTKEGLGLTDVEWIE